MAKLFFKLVGTEIRRLWGWRLIDNVRLIVPLGLGGKTQECQGEIIQFGPKIGVTFPSRSRTQFRSFRAILVARGHALTYVK